MSEGAAGRVEGEARTRTRLDRGVIIAVAARLAATEGIDKLTMRRLGEALQADPTAIYRHFKDKDELLFGVADRLFGTGPELDLSKGWREAAREQINVGLERYRVHPDLAQLLALQPDTTPSLTLIIERTLTAFVAAGLPLEKAAEMYHVVENHVVGTGLYYSLIENAPDGSLDRGAQRRAYALLPADRFPHAAAAAPYLFPDPDHIFALGTELILDAVERLAQRGGTSTNPSEER